MFSATRLVVTILFCRCELVRPLSIVSLAPILIFIQAIQIVSSSTVDTNIFKTPFNLNVTLTAIQNARDSIVNVTDEFWQANRTNLSAKFLRLSFHDSIGGMDGCVDLTDMDNFGLDIPIDALKPIVTQFSTQETGLSRADIWALAGLTGVEISQVSNTPYKFPLQYIGRVDCDSDRTVVCQNVQNDIVPCAYNSGPRRVAPSPDLDTVELLHFFYTTFGFSARQTVVIMGAHTIGFAKRENSGFDGSVGWVLDPHRFNNEYYRMIIGAGNCVGEYIEEAPDWFRETMSNKDLKNDKNISIPDRFVWTHPNENRDSPSLIMTSSDMALVRDFTESQDSNSKAVTCKFIQKPHCPYSSQTGHLAAEYRNNNKMWIRDFRDTFNLMISRGYNTTVVEQDTSDECVNCLTQVDFSLTLSPTSVPTSMPTGASSTMPTRPTTSSHSHSPIASPITSTATTASAHSFMLATSTFCILTFSFLVAG